MIIIILISIYIVSVFLFRWVDRYHSHKDGGNGTVWSAGWYLVPVWNTIMAIVGIGCMLEYTRFWKWFSNDDLKKP